MLTLAFAPAGTSPPVPRGREVHLWRDDHWDVVARGLVDGAARWIDWPCLGVFRFSPASTAVEAWPVAGAKPHVVLEYFETVLQPLILQALGREALHAGAVAGSGGALAFCGVRRAGKSTLTRALRDHGWTHIADDALVLEAAAAPVMALALPFMSRLRDSARQHFGDRTPDGTITRSPGPVALPLKAIFLITQADGGADLPRAVRVPFAAAFPELITHAHSFDLDDKSETRRLSQDYLTVAQHVPVFALAYRRGLEHLPETLQAIARTASTVGVEPAPAAAGVAGG